MNWPYEIQCRHFFVITNFVHGEGWCTARFKKRLRHLPIKCMDKYMQSCTVEVQDVMGPGVQSIIFCGYGKSGSDYRIKHLCFFMKNSDESNGRICSLQISLFTSILS